MPDMTSAFVIRYMLQVECNESGQQTRQGQVNRQSHYNVHRVKFDRERHSVAEHGGLCHFLEQIRGLEGSKCQLYYFANIRESCVRCGCSQ